MEGERRVNVREIIIKQRKIRNGGWMEEKKGKKSNFDFAAC